MNHGGAMQQHATAICATFRILFADEKLHERKFAEHFAGAIYQLEQKLNIILFFAKDKARHHQVGTKVLQGIFMGFALHAGGSWHRYMLVVDAKELQENHGPEVYVKRINAREVIVVQDGDKFIFPCSNRMIKMAGKESGAEFGKISKEKNTEVFSKRTNQILQSHIENKMTWKQILISSFFSHHDQERQT